MRLFFYVSLALWSFLAFTNVEAASFSKGCAGNLILTGQNNRPSVELIEPGSTVYFDDGASFEIKTVISAQGSNGAFLLRNGRVLRVAMDRPDSINRFLDGYQPLLEQEIPIPRIIALSRDKWSITEFIESEFSLADVLAVDSLVPKAWEKMLREEFRRFAAKFRNFNLISGLDLDKIVYVKNRGWVLLDWLDGHRMGTTLNPFVPIFGFKSTESKIRIGERNYDTKRLILWRHASDEAVAKARGQSPVRYFRMTQKKYDSLVSD